MMVRTRVLYPTLVALLLGTTGQGMTRYGTGRAVAALTAQGTVFAGTITCTLDDSFTYNTPTYPGGRHDMYSWTEHGKVAFTLVAGKPITAAGTYYADLINEEISDPINGSAGGSVTTEIVQKGSATRTSAMPDDFPGFQLGVPSDLYELGFGFLPTQTNIVTGTSGGQVTSRTQTPGGGDEWDYPSGTYYGTPGTMPVLTVTDGTPKLVGGISKDVIDPYAANKADGQEKCTWSLVVVQFNGGPLQGHAGNDNVTDTPTPSPSLSRTPTTTPTGTVTPTVTPTEIPTATSTATSTETPTEMPTVCSPSSAPGPQTPAVQVSDAAKSWSIAPAAVNANQSRYDPLATDSGVQCFRMNKSPDVKVVAFINQLAFNPLACIYRVEGRPSHCRRHRWGGGTQQAHLAGSLEAGARLCSRLGSCHTHGSRPTGDNSTQGNRGSVRRSLHVRQSSVATTDF